MKKTVLFTLLAAVLGVATSIWAATCIKDCKASSESCKTSSCAAEGTCSSTNPSCCK